MSQLREAFDNFSRSPTPEALQCYASQLEVISRMMPPETIKTALISSITPILRTDKYEHIRRDVSMLRIYKILGRVSQKLGSAGIYEQLEKKGHFKSSLQFYLQWAEEYAKQKKLERFQMVLDLARSRLADEMEMPSIESGFRDLAEEFFAENVDHIFVSPDDTMCLFTTKIVPDGKKTKRRSSVCHLLQYAPTVKENATGIQLRQECVDTADEFGLSIEELRFAKWSDTFGEEVNVAVIRRDSGIPKPLKTKPDVEERLGGKRRQLSTLCESMEEEEKRSRIYSPVVPTKDAVRPPFRDIQTITLSSDTHTKQSTADDVSFDDDKLRVMASGRKENTHSTSQSSTLRTAKSGGGLDLLAENKCLEARALFSDTVLLDADVTKTVATASNMTSNFSVLCDPDPTMHVPNDRPKKVSSGLNMIYDEEAPEVEDEEPFTIKTTPPTFDDDVLDDDDATFSLPRRSNIVTSTPAAGVTLVGLEEYFGNEDNVADKPPAQTFLAPTSSTINRLIRRKSQVAAPAIPAVPAKPIAATAATNSKNTSMDVLTENLGRRLSLGAEEIAKAAALADEAETTGIKNRRRSEVMKGDLNPWDEDLRRKLMSMVRPPTNMHELPTRAPKIQAMRDFEAGGETFRINTLIGQGGYAKVYRAKNEEGATVAVKYEVPSCAWEVYICDQMRNRLLKEGRTAMANWCIMQVMDAYVFSTASLLVNEYHEYGTLLEYANNMKDPNWHVTCFLLTQMAAVLKEVHACKIIHGDVKPDNFMITRKIDLAWDKDTIMSPDAYVIKLIDWGRAIDMMPLAERSFKGRAGTEGFDSPEMIDGRSWTYQADYFGYAATMAVLATGKYAKLTGESVGNYSLPIDIKRRNVLRDAILDVIQKFLNIASCQQLPDWNETIDSFVAVWNNEFDISAWRQAAAKFNESCDLVVKSRQ